MALWHSAAHTVHMQILLHLCKRFTQTHRHWAAFLLWRLLSYTGGDHGRNQASNRATTTQCNESLCYRTAQNR
nr:MAG TPA: hypothetical protein [Caudoviricetes sp.]